MVRLCAMKRGVEVSLDTNILFQCCLFQVFREVFDSYFYLMDVSRDLESRKPTPLTKTPSPTSQSIENNRVKIQKVDK